MRWFNHCNYWGVYCILIVSQDVDGFCPSPIGLRIRKGAHIMPKFLVLTAPWQSKPQRQSPEATIQPSDHPCTASRSPDQSRSSNPNHQLVAAPLIDTHTHTHTQTACWSSSLKKVYIYIYNYIVVERQTIQVNLNYHTHILILYIYIYIWSVDLKFIMSSNFDGSAHVSTLISGSPVKSWELGSHPSRQEKGIPTTSRYEFNCA